MQLDASVALITGSGVRLGRAIALALAQRGTRIVVHYNTSSVQALQTVAAIRDLGSEAIAVRADLSRTAELASLIDAGAAAFGQVDVLINSASIFRRGTLQETTEDMWDQHMAINLKAPFFLAQAFAQRLGGQPGHIINLADWRATRPGTQYLAYTLTKAGLITLTKSLALALAPSVLVNAIAPGAILPASGGDDQNYFQRLGQRLPVKHTGSPKDITDAVLYLLQSDFVTGEILMVTGGEHL
jgi:pteridine reductase